jgi:hypothetical protein
VTATADHTRDVSSWPLGQAGAALVRSVMLRWTSNEVSQVRQR